MKMELDIENITLNEYLEYEAKMERRLRKSARSKRNLTIYDEAYFNSFHRVKSRAFNYDEDIKINKYNGLPPLHLCFQHGQPYTEAGLVFYNTSDEVDIDNMTIAVYELYIAKQELSFEEIFGNFLKMEVENLRGMKQEEAKVEECDGRDKYNIWDITVKDVERLRKLLTPSVHTLPEPDLVVQPCVPPLPSLDEVNVVRKEELNNDVDIISIQVPDVMDNVIQPSIPQTKNTTPPDKDYVAPAIKSILDEFREEILNITVVDEEADFNLTRDIEELKHLIATNNDPSFTTIKVLPCIVKTNVEHETFI
uniref:Uncharacterized protein n=1 Tax=Tanacetum cinerariifolium TaxID=118510 RepID=A0A6L2K7N1_TANCI|nr:hypothetical protein [Tanacetum cinerariifolium]